SGRGRQRLTRRGSGGRAPGGVLAVVERPLVHKPCSTYPFDLRHPGPDRRCRIRAAAHVGSRPCCREQPRLRPTQLQPASLGSTTVLPSLIRCCSPVVAAAGAKRNTLSVLS